MQTERIFIEALKASGEVTAYTDDRIYAVAIPAPEEEALNTPVPYIIVMFGGFTNEALTKDDIYEGGIDRVTISILIAAGSPDELADLGGKVREAVMAYFTAYEPPEDGEDLSDLIPIDYSLSGGQKAYDDLKPCYTITLQYICTINNQHYE